MNKSSSGFGPFGATYRVPARLNLDSTRMLQGLGAISQLTISEASRAILLSEKATRDTP